MRIRCALFREVRFDVHLTKMAEDAPPKRERKTAGKYMNVVCFIWQNPLDVDLTKTAEDAPPTDGKLN